MNTRSEALSKCRYYSGEDVCPFSVDSLKHYWELEWVYVAHDVELDKLQDELYLALGGKDFSGIPRALLIVMFTAWGKGVWDIKKSLPNFYKFIDDYLQIASDHYPIDEIPHNQ